VKYVIFIFVIVSLTSCKLFEDKDTTNPIVNFTIDGGNEICREVTLYLDIEDDSEIDSVQVVIDDSTYATTHYNFDTITFTVNEFEYYEGDEENLSKSNSSNESEMDEIQYLSVIAYDKEGNIGESEKQEVVITEFPGWRKYHTIEKKNDYYVPTTFLVDENSLIWIGLTDGVVVYNPIENSTRELTIPSTTDYSNNYINDIALVEGSRVWIASDWQISEYIYDINKWIQVAVPPPDTAYGGNNEPLPYDALIWSITVDANYNVYIGTDGSYISKYNGAEIQQFALLGASVFSMKVHPDGTVYYFNEWGQQSYIKNDIVYEYEDFPYEDGMKLSMIIDANGVVWLEPHWPQSGCFLFDGTTWSRLATNSRVTEYIYPLLGAKNGTVYAEINTQDSVNEYGNREFQNQGIATYDGISWTYWRDLDTPFKSYPEGTSPYVRYFNSIIDEAPNGDIWMVLDYTLWRYRPSLGGYP